MSERRSVKTFSIVPRADERKERVCCALCGSDDSAVHWECDGFGFVRCRRCGHIYQNPRPVFDDLKTRYQDEYFHYELVNDKPFFELMRKGLDDIRFDLIEASTSPPRRALDIGCATGMLVRYLVDRGWRAEGVEICAPAARFGRDMRGVTIHVGTLDSQRFSDDSFDFVHFSHVIEHVPDPRGFLEEVVRITKPGGYVVIVTPNTASLQARLFGRRWRSAIADHLNLFSGRTIRRLMEESGLSVCMTRTWGGIAAGIAPAIVKRPIDWLAKLLGFGDVVLQLGRARDHDIATPGEEARTDAVS